MQIKEIGDRFREKEQHWQQTHNSFDSVKATPNEGKSCIGDDYPSEIEPRILRSSNSINGMTNEGSNSLRGNGSSNLMRSKRESRSHETENNFVMPPSLHDKKVTRKSDPPKVGRIGKTTRPVIATQAPLTHKRTSRDQVQGIKERDSKKKIWSR